MKKIIAFIIIAVLSLGFGISIRGSTPVTDSKLKTAITVTDGKIHSENEGKLVVVSGELKPELPVVDPLTDISIPYIKASRQVDEFRHKKGTDYVYEWYNLINDYSEENNGGINSDRQMSGVIIAKTHIGEIELEPKLLIGLNTGTDWNDISEENFGKNSYKIFKERKLGKIYFSDCDKFGDFYESYRKDEDEYEGIEFKDRVGSHRYSYKVMDDDGSLEYTVLGIQKGNKIVEDTEIDCQSLMKGLHDAEEFRESVISGNTKIYIGLIVVGVIFTGLSIYSIIQRSKKKKQKYK